MTNLFKTRFVPNDDGTDSVTQITNINTVFVHTYIGDDFSGDGTREYPYKSIFKANQKIGVTYIIFRGVINEYFQLNNKNLIGDDINQQLLFLNYNPVIYEGPFCNNMTVDSVSGSVNSRAWSHSIIKSYNVSSLNNFSYLLVENIARGSSNDGRRDRNILQSTFLGNEIGSCTIKNCIQVSEYNWINTSNGTNKYVVFPSTCIFKYNNIPLIQPEWTNDSKTNIQIIRNLYLESGMSQQNLDSLFMIDSFGNETCRIIKESRNGGTSGNIFNMYNTDGSILDYSLNPQSNNEALYASDLGGYVGCFGPANPILPTDLDVQINVNSDGSDDVVNAATLLRGNVDNTFDFNTASDQIWNRMRSHTTISIPNGVKFKGSQSMEDDGSAFGYYFGKKQNLLDITILTTGSTLEADTLYKVCNTIKDVFSAVLYNGTQYLPDYFFKTGTDVLNYSLLNEGSGTIVRKVLSIPFESEEIIPYDDINTPSVSFPKFSCPFFGIVLMLFHKIGDRIDLPVLFSEITSDKISYYSDYAITTADNEFVILSADSVNYYYKIPAIKFFRIELNAHFDEDYA